MELLKEEFTPINHLVEMPDEKYDVRQHIYWDCDKSDAWELSQQNSAKYMAPQQKRNCNRDLSLNGQSFGVSACILFLLFGIAA